VRAPPSRHRARHWANLRSVHLRSVRHLALSASPQRHHRIPALSRTSSAPVTAPSPEAEHEEEVEEKHEAEQKHVEACRELASLIWPPFNRPQVFNDMEAGTRRPSEHADRLCYDSVGLNSSPNLSRILRRICRGFVTESVRREQLRAIEGVLMPPRAANAELQARTKQCKQRVRAPPRAADARFDGCESTTTRNTSPSLAVDDHSYCEPITRSRRPAARVRAVQITRIAQTSLIS
jgi:hypothetical protein